MSCFMPLFRGTVWKPRRHHPARFERRLGLPLACALGLGLVRAGAAATSTAGPPDVMGMDLEQLYQTKVETVVGASKHEQKVTEAPSSVSIVTRDDIQKFGYRTMADVLRSVRGLYVNYDRAYSFVGLRGINRPGDYGGPILLMVDGHRINEPIYDSAMIDQEFPLDLDLIDRVEVIRGPGSVLYGNNAFFGVINVVTRRGQDLNGAEVSGAAASWDTYSGRFSYGKRFTNGVEVLFSGTYLDSAGHDRLFYPEFSQVNHGFADQLDGQTAQKYYGSVSYGDFSLTTLYGEREKVYPTAPYATSGAVFNDPRFRSVDKRGYVELKFRHEFENDWEVMTRLHADHYSFIEHAPYIYDTNNPVATLNIDRPKAEWWGGELQVSKRLFEQHLVTAGVEGRQDVLLRQYNYDVDPPWTYIDKNTPAANLGLYLQGEFSLRTNLLLTAGARYDYYTSFGSAANPRAGLIYSPWDMTTWKLLYGQAYRAPNAYEFDYEAVDYAPNHSLQPETIQTYELAWEQGLGKGLRLTTSVFYNHINDLIAQVDETADPAVGGFIFRNTGAASVKGAEVELDGRWAHGWRGRLSYAFAQATDDRTGQVLANSPRHVGQFALSVPVYREKVFASFDLQALGDRLTVRRQQAAGFVTANFTLFSRDIVKGLEVSASLYNLFDARYANPVGPDFLQDTIEQDGRSFRVKLTYRF